MPKSAGEFAAIALIVLACVGIRYFLASAGFGGSAATAACVIAGLLLVAATVSLRSYPAIGITIYIVLGLIFIGLAIYVNAYRTL